MPVVSRGVSAGGDRRQRYARSSARILGSVAQAVFVFAGLDLTVFPSLEAAAGCGEAIDIKNGEYDFFADDGTLLQPEVQGQRVTLRVTAEQLAEELRERLRRYLVHPRVTLDASLADDPVVAAHTILRADWARRSFR